MISLLFIIVAAACNACMDTLSHHWSISVFYKLSKGKSDSFWGDPGFTWLRKYVNNDVRTRKKWFWKIKYPVQFSDGFHFFKMWMIINLGIGFVLASILGPVITFKVDWILSINWASFINFTLNLLLFGLVFNTTFSLFYNKILLWKKK